jgi:hypothetical protein
MKRLFLFLLFAVTATFCSCTADDDVNMTNTVTMKINGVSRTFEPLGYETVLLQGGQYRLIISMYANDGLSEESAELVTTYGDTGHNALQEFHITLNPAGYNDNAVQGTFSSHINTNTATEFEATFAGAMGSGNNTVTITNGHVRYVYDDPLGI